MNDNTPPHLRSSSVAPLYITSTSFNCSQEQPSVLDYSQQGMDTVPDTFLPRGFAPRDSRGYGHGGGLESYAGGEPRDSEGDAYREDGATATTTEVFNKSSPVPPPAGAGKEEAAILRTSDEENNGSPLAGSSLGGKRDGVAMVPGVPLHSEGDGGGKNYEYHGEKPSSTEQQHDKGGGKHEGAVMAKVKTRRSPRRPIPGYLSASRDGLGAASRWGALSKAHLEFHRLGTAGACRDSWGLLVNSCWHDSY